MPRGGTRRGAGRPKIKAADRLSELIAIPCTPAQKARYRKLLKAARAKIMESVRTQLG